MNQSYMLTYARILTSTQ